MRRQKNMNRRYIGDCVINLRYLGENQYEGAVTADGEQWPFTGLRVPTPKAERGQDLALDRAAADAVEFVSSSRGPLAAKIRAAADVGRDPKEGFQVRRTFNGPVRSVL